MNLSSVEILMLHYLNDGVPVDSIPNQQFWKDRYHSKAKNIIKDLMRKDYIYIQKDIDKSLNHLRVKDLREILRNKDLMVSGNKDELIDRIKSNSIDLNPYLKDFYILSPKAKKIVENTKEIKDIHNNSSGDIRLYNPPSNINDIIHEKSKFSKTTNVFNLLDMFILLGKSIFLSFKLLFYPLVFLFNFTRFLNKNLEKNKNR